MEYFVISGLPGLSKWPESSVVVHDVPGEDVIVSDLQPGYSFDVDIRHHGSSVDRVAASDGVIVLPSSVFDRALENHLSLVLLRSGNPYLGVISFLPDSETEPYTVAEYITIYGAFQTTSVASRTDFVSVEDVTDIVISGTSSSSYMVVCAAFNENREFVRVLLDGNETYDNMHLKPDGTYSYIVACGMKSAPRSCIVYYGTRNKKKSVPKDVER